MNSINLNYLENTIKLFTYYKNLGDKTFKQLDDNDAIFWSYNDESNSISIIVKHMVGNMFSRWTNFLTEDGEKEWRKRDSEFMDSYQNKKEMLAAWEKGWECLLSALTNLNDNDLHKIIYIRNEGHTVLDAINRQLAHYAYHVGQLVFTAKMIKNDDWNTLSIAKNKSLNYNKNKFKEAKSTSHFTKNL